MGNDNQNLKQLVDGLWSITKWIIVAVKVFETITVNLRSSCTYHIHLSLCSESVTYEIRL